MKKGTTLIEVLVAFAIFALSIVVVLSTYSITNKIKKNEIDYLYFETICQDIDKYYTKYKSNWTKFYFSENEDPINDTVYYDSNYKVTNEENEKAYALTYNYINFELVISIRNLENDKLVIDSLNYGASRNE